MLASVPFGSAHAAATTKDAEIYVNTLGNKALGIIGNKTLAKPQKQTQLEKIFSENVDVPWVGKFVLGRFWKEVTEPQKKAYLAEYERFLVRNYASGFADYSGGTFKVTGSQDEGDEEFIVNMEIASAEAGSEPVLVDYRVRNEKGGFKVYDIIVEGVSMIQTQRSEFSSILNSEGIEYLTKQLASKSVAPIVADKKS
jgi:phospholipid transport system substrate-binding protein